MPQALLGVASVGVLFATVRRWYGPAAGLIAGAVLALTPVATLMFRFNNPDALLVLLLVPARTPRCGRWRRPAPGGSCWSGCWSASASSPRCCRRSWWCPVFAGVYLLAAPTGFWRRIRQLLLAGLALIVAAGWWVATWNWSRPAPGRTSAARSSNSILELTLGYNGLGRITGDEEGSVGGGARMGGGGGPFSGQTGWLRMFDTEIGGQVSWLLPAALILLVAGLVLAGRAARTDRRRAGLLLWGGWLLVTGLIFSFMSGIFHAYYTVALAPAVGALVGIGTVLLWRERRALAADPPPGHRHPVPAGPVAAPGGDAATAPGVDSATGSTVDRATGSTSWTPPRRVWTPRPGRWPVVAGPSGGGGGRHRHPGRRPRGDRLVVLATTRPQP